MEAHTEDAKCSAKGCGELATTICDRCGQPLCPTHVRHVVIQRREERTERTTKVGALARLPIRTETYVLCASCKTKPVPYKLSPSAL